MSNNKSLQVMLTASLILFPLYSAVAFQDTTDRIREFRYAIIEVPGLGGVVDQPLGMNDLGHIVGESVPKNGQLFHPFFWDGNKSVDLGTFGGEFGAANDVNNQDWVVGNADQQGNGNGAFLWKNGGDLIDLGNFGNANATARGINSHNQIVGTAGTENLSDGHAFLWENGVMQDLGTLNGFGTSQAFDINENGFITGYSNSPDNNQTFLWDPNTGEMSRIGSLGDGFHQNQPSKMNNFNDIVGGAAVDDLHNGGPRPYIFHDGVMYNLQKIYAVDKGFAGGWSNGINDAGQVVGFMNWRNEKEGFNSYVFLWEKGIGMQLLDDFLPANSNWHITEGSAINEPGQIAALAQDIDTRDSFRTLLLTPVNPELVLDAGDGPLVAGEVNELKVTGAEVGAVVSFVYGKVGGGARIPGCADLDAMLQINEAKTIGTAVADENGVAVIKTLINPNAAGLKGRLLQAYDADNCQESQLIQKRIQ